LEGLFLPSIKADFKARPDVHVLSLARDVEKVVDEFVKYNCFSKQDGSRSDADASGIPSGIFLKFTPGSFFIEVDVFADQKVFHKQMRDVGFQDLRLEVNGSHAKGIYAIVMKNLFCMPDNKESKELFRNYVGHVEKLGVRFYYSDDADKKLAQSRFVSTFAAFYRSYIEKHYFKLDFRPFVHDDAQSLKPRFTAVDILIPSDQERNTGWKKIWEAQKIRQFIEQGYQFFGYDNSIYDYVKFDTLTEKQFADYAETVLST